METTKPATKPKRQRKKPRKKSNNTSSPWSNGCSEERAKSIFLTGPDIPTHLLNKALNTRGFFKSTAKLSPSATPYKPPTSAETKQETTKKSDKKSKTKKKTRKKKTTNASNQNQNWWQTNLDETIVDPISLDPIRDLLYPPFEIISSHTNEDGEAAQVKHYFDGQFLAHYIVSTANFIDPINRAALDHATCVRLDQYLKEHRLPSAGVEMSFRILESADAAAASKSNSSQGGNATQAQRLRREATVVMASLFRNRSGTRSDDEEDNESKATNSRGNNSRGNKSNARSSRGTYSYEQRTTGQGSGMVMVDDDDLIAPAAYNMQGESDFPSFDAPEVIAARAQKAARDSHLHASETQGMASTTTPSTNQSMAANDMSAASGGDAQWLVVSSEGSTPYMESNAEFPNLEGKQRMKAAATAATAASKGGTAAWSKTSRSMPTKKLASKVRTGRFAPPPSSSSSSLTSRFAATPSSSSRWGGLEGETGAAASTTARTTSIGAASSRPARMKLKLKKRSTDTTSTSSSISTSETTTAATTSTDEKQSSNSIFGGATPRSNASTTTTARRVTSSSSSSFTASTALSVPLEDIITRPLCPYSGWLLGVGRKFGSRWILSIENSLRADLQGRIGGIDTTTSSYPTSSSASLYGTTSSSASSSLSLPPMPRLQRKFVHEYLQKHWGLKTTGVDPEPNRFVQILYKTSHPRMPLMFLSRAISMYPDLALEMNSQRDADIKTPPMSRSMRLGLFNIHGAGGLRAAKSQIGALLGSIARRSEYQLDWSGAHHLCVAFEGGQKVMHKVYKQLIMMHGRNGSLTWNDPVRWWPENSDWIARQLWEKEEAKKRMEKNRKMNIKLKEEEYQQRKQAIQFAEESRTHTGNDAWDDEEEDEDDPKNSKEMAAVTQQKLLLAREERTRKSRKQNRNVQDTRAVERVGIVDIAAQTDANLWNNLSSSESDSDWEREADEQEAANTFTDTLPSVSADLKIAGSVENKTNCELCDTNLSIALGGITEASSIDEIRLVDLDIPKCRRCKKIICRSCSNNWKNSNQQTGTCCPFCRIKNYLDDFVYQRTQMKNAGFLDEDRNVLILRQTNGDVHQAIAILLEENEQEEKEKKDSGSGSGSEGSDDDDFGAFGAQTNR